jgi:hypothetical protein
MLALGPARSGSRWASVKPTRGARSMAHAAFSKRASMRPPSSTTDSVGCRVSPSLDAGFALRRGLSAAPGATEGSQQRFAPGVFPGMRGSLLMVIGRLRAQNRREGVENTRSSGTSGRDYRARLAAPGPIPHFVPAQGRREVLRWSARSTPGDGHLRRPSSGYAAMTPLNRYCARSRCAAGGHRGVYAVSTPHCSLVGPPVFHRLLVDLVLLLPAPEYPACPAARLPKSA